MNIKCRARIAAQRISPKLESQFEPSLVVTETQNSEFTKCRCLGRGSDMGLDWHKGLFSGEGGGVFILRDGTPGRSEFDREICLSLWRERETFGRRSPGSSGDPIEGGGGELTPMEDPRGWVARPSQEQR